MDAARRHGTVGVSSPKGPEMPSPTPFETRNTPPSFEPIIVCAAVFVVGIMLICTLLVAAS